MVGVTLTDLKDSSITVKVDIQTLDFFCINSFKLKIQLVGGSLVWHAVVWAALHISHNIISILHYL